MLTIIYGVGRDHPRSITATDDADAVQTVRDLVIEGLRNEAWANVQLSDGRTYRARNEHGLIIDDYLPAA